MKIASIFKSINGEVNSSHQGSICGFIRLAECNCRCSYCDTKQYQEKKSGKDMNIKQILKAVDDFKCANVTITGGEPLLQKQALKTLILELRHTHKISIETNGSIRIPIDFPSDISWVIDYKCSSSNMKDKMKLSNFRGARYNDFIKFVIADRKDFDDAISLITKVKDHRHDYHMLKWCFSPMFNEGKPSIKTKELLRWIYDEELLRQCSPIINVQIHKILNIE